jgi:hypothetical protein
MFKKLMALFWLKFTGKLAEIKLIINGKIKPTRGPKVAS